MSDKNYKHICLHCNNCVHNHKTDVWYCKETNEVISWRDDCSNCTNFDLDEVYWGRND